MLVLSRESQSIRDDVFPNFHRYVRPGDCLVVNNTRVFPARLRGRRNRPDGADVEVFLIRCVSTDDEAWTALVKPAKRVRAGDVLLFSPDLKADVTAEGAFGQRQLLFHSGQPLLDALERIGSVPLPPYIHREPDAADRERYQTVFAEHTGSVAAPTAGLHFTRAMFGQCRAAGAEIAHVTLHVGLGTFAPLREQELSRVQLHAEHFELTETNASLIREAKRIFCVGTTSVRAVESVFQRGVPEQMQGETNLFISPGYSFQATGAMLTNFHLPQSSLLILVCSFAGRELALAAYRHAVAEKYRFFSYGDCMLIE